MLRPVLAFFLILLPFGFVLAQTVQTTETSAPGVSANLATSPQSPRKIRTRPELTGTWMMGLGALHMKDELSNQKTQTVFIAGVNLSYDLTSFLNMKANPRARFRSGHVQSDSATVDDKSSFLLTEASANLHDAEWVELSLGALNGGDFFSRAVVDEDLAFPAARLSLQAGQKKSSFASVFAEFGVPTSASLTSNSRDYEKTPSFAAGGLRGQYLNSGWTLKSRAEYFQFANLPSGVATDSGLLGNTVIGQNQSAASEFAYEYRGVEAMLGARFDVSRSLGFAFEANGLKNSGAPDGLNQAVMANASLDLWAGSMKWTPGAEYFRIEPDAAVAYYNSSFYQTNRVGYAGSLAAQYKRLFKVKALGGARDVVFESASQSRESFMMLTLETLDALL